MTTINGTISADRLVGGNDEDILNGNDGNDTVFGGYFDDIVNGDSGDDRLFGGYHDDTMDGGSGDDRLFGGYHDDIIDGGSGDDLLFGGGHNDLLNGGSGNDSLRGDMGEDTLTGGDGADRFIFDSLDSLDLITDFDSNQGDKIVFDTAMTGITEVGDLTVSIGSSSSDILGPSRVTSLYVDGERIIEFDGLVSLQIEDFEFI